MNLRMLALCAGIVAIPLSAAKWPDISKDVWELSKDPALVAQGGVVLDRMLDFQGNIWKKRFASGS